MSIKKLVEEIREKSGVLDEARTRNTRSKSMISGDDFFSDSIQSAVDEHAGNIRVNQVARSLIELLEDDEDHEISMRDLKAIDRLFKQRWKSGFDKFVFEFSVELGEEIFKMLN